MVFFDASLRRGGRELVFRMRTALRAALVAAFLSVAAMLVFNFGPEDWASAGMLGKANVIVVPALLLAASLYQYRLGFDADDEEIVLARGLWPFLKPERFPFSAFVGVQCRSYATRTGDLAGRRCLFAIVLSGRTIVLERSVPKAKAAAWLKLLAAYYPHTFSISE